MVVLIVLDNSNMEKRLHEFGGMMYAIAVCYLLSILMQVVLSFKIVSLFSYYICVSPLLFKTFWIRQSQRQAILADS